MYLRASIGNMNFAVVLVVSFGILCLQCTSQNVPIVETPLGKVQGFYSTSMTGKIFSAFEGIPYAQPPTGDLRFKEPQVIQPWEGILEANKRRKCLQIGNENNGEEDCLYVNVYSPTEAPNSNDNLDVIVYIHGGAFITGVGSDAQPTLLIDGGLLLVSMNYRLGVLGFLCTMDEAVSCNNGLKDQNLALKWVQENIRSFGGNPDSVTITGISAGAASVHYHYLSPLSKGLFHRGFSLSGTALNPWAFQREPLGNAMRIAASVDCANVSNLAIVECLRAAPAMSVVNALFALQYYLSFPLAPIAPSLEPVGDGAFLPDHPYKLLETGNFNDVPWLTSCTPDEGIYFVFSSGLDKDLDTLNEKWDEVIHYILDTNSTAAEEDQPMVAHEIKEYYFGDRPITTSELNILSKLDGDREFLEGFQRASLTQASSSNSSVYAFICAYIGDYTCTDNFDTDLKGVCHSDDSQYIFYQLGAPSENNVAMSKLYLNMLQSFVKTEKPDVQGINWTPISDPEVMTYLYIQGPDDISLRRTRDLFEFQFWDSLPLKEYEHEDE